MQADPKTVEKGVTDKGSEENQVGQDKQVRGQAYLLAPCLHFWNITHFRAWVQSFRFPFSLKLNLYAVSLRDFVGSPGLSNRLIALYGAGAHRNWRFSARISLARCTDESSVAWMSVASPDITALTASPMGQGHR
jgi:hypothetical protein